MKVAYLITLIVIILLSMIGIIGEREDLHLRDRLTAVLIVAIPSFIISTLWL